MKYALSAMAFAASVSVAFPVFADEPPTANIGLSGKLLTEMPLGPEFETTGNRQLRMRILTVEKGGVVALHSHTKRPSVEYVMKGMATEFKDGAEHVYREGDVVSADHTTSHWWRNDSDGDLVILAVDIYQPD